VPPSRLHRLLAEGRAQLRLAGPIILSQVAQVLAGLVDTVMSGQAGAREQAVVGIGVALWVPVFLFLMNVVQSLSPIVAHHFGAGDHRAVVRDTQDGVWLAAWSGALPLALVPFAPAVLEFAGIDAALAARTGVFLWGIGLGLPAAMVFRALSFYSASLNHTRPMMVLALLGLGVNAALNDVLIHGRLGLPAMGGAGCGWATGIGMWVGLAAFAAWTARSRAYAAWYLWRDWRRPRWEAQKRLLRLGLPMGAAGLAESAAFSSVAVLVGRFGAVQIAAHQVAINFAAMVFMLPLGLSAAMAVRIGHALGAGDARDARHVAWTGMAIAVVFALAAMGPIFGLRHLVAAVYSNDDQVRALAAQLLLFASAWILFDATQVCAMGALRGYKVTFAPMLMMLLAFWGVGVPVGTWLGWHGVGGSGPMKVQGFWIGLVAGLVTVSVGLVALLRHAADRAVRDEASRRAQARAAAAT
jgi:MATE family multidrug resistance protein